MKTFALLGVEVVVGRATSAKAAQRHDRTAKPASTSAADAPDADRTLDAPTLGRLLRTIVPRRWPSGSAGQCTAEQSVIDTNQRAVPRTHARAAQPNRGTGPPAPAAARQALKVLACFASSPRVRDCIDPHTDWLDVRFCAEDDEETFYREMPAAAATVWERVARRTADILIAGSALVVFSPLMAVIWVGVRATSPGPALITQRRVGLARRAFCFYKFRTMRVGVDDSALREMIARELRGEDASSGGSWKLDGDSRITAFGSFLRRTSLDELPQLISVLRGDMSLVGPRPCLVWEAEMFPSEFNERFAVRPGMTGLWQVSGRSTMGTLDMLRLDVNYARHQTLRGDLAILARTLPAVLRGDGAR